MLNPYINYVLNIRGTTPHVKEKEDWVWDHVDHLLIV